MIEKIIEEYENELKIMIHNKYPRDVITYQFSNYQKTLRDNLLHKDFKNNYNSVFDMYKNYILENVSPRRYTQKRKT